MRNVLLTGISLTGLFRSLAKDVKGFVKEEMALAKSEMSEKISCYGRNATFLVIGGFVGYAGLIVLLGGFGILTGRGLQTLDIDPLLANFIGLGAVGVLAILIGAMLILNAMKAFSSETLVPEKTMVTIKHLRGTDELAMPESRHAEKVPIRSSDELQSDVLATEDLIGETLEEIAYRTSPARIKTQTDEHIHTHPYQWSLFALVGGMISSLFLARKFASRK